MSLGDPSSRRGHELVSNDVKPRPAEPGEPPAKTPSNRDTTKYDSPGLTFLRHDPPAAISVAAFRANQPAFAVGAGAPLADGKRGTLGAFGGDDPGW